MVGVLIGSGCGDAGIDQATDELCLRMRTCFGQVGQEACEDVERDILGSGDIEPKCADAFSDYILCLSELSCDELQAVEGQCVERIDEVEVFEACR